MDFLSGHWFFTVVTRDCFLPFYGLHPFKNTSQIDGRFTFKSFVLSLSHPVTQPILVFPVTGVSADLLTIFFSPFVFVFENLLLISCLPKITHRLLVLFRMLFS